MENLARWTLAQAFGLLGTLTVMFRDHYRMPVPSAELGDLLVRYGLQASALGLTLAFWPVSDLVFRACAPERAWQCAGGLNRWLCAMLLFFLCGHAAALGLVAMSDPPALARVLEPSLFHAYGAALAATAVMSLAYVVRLEFVLASGHTSPKLDGDGMVDGTAGYPRRRDLGR